MGTYGMKRPVSLMNKYEIIRRIGLGSYGQVYFAKNKFTSEKVALKIMFKQFKSKEECLRLPEVQCLREIRHENVIDLKEVIFEKTCLVLVFELMSHSLFEILYTPKCNIIHICIRSVMVQILNGIQCVHSQGYMHRDIKPENVLLSVTHSAKTRINQEISDQIIKVKVADFGLARAIAGPTSFSSYVATRWYRSPELLLHLPYGTDIDIWACGVLFAELYLKAPLFPGTDEADQLDKICQLLGFPEKNDYPEAVQALMIRGFGPHRQSLVQADTLRSRIPQANDEALELILDMLSWNPQRRPTPAAALNYSFFAGKSRRSSVDVFHPTPGGDECNQEQFTWMKDEVNSDLDQKGLQQDADLGFGGLEALDGALGSDLLTGGPVAQREALHCGQAAVVRPESNKLKIFNFNLSLESPYHLVEVNEKCIDYEDVDKVWNGEQEYKPAGKFELGNFEPVVCRRELDIPAGSFRLN